MIYVFKTSVKRKKHVRLLTPRLNELLHQATWNFDLDDCDNILRVDSKTDVASRVISELKSCRFYCEELK